MAAPEKDEVRENTVEDTEATQAASTSGEESAKQAPETKASDDKDAKDAPASEGAKDKDAEAKEDAEDPVAAAKKEAAAWQDKYLRLHAEWDTYRRRMNEQREEERARAAEKLVESLLPVIDDFERSIAYAEEHGEEGLLSGVEAVHTKMVDVLSKQGVEVIDPKGEPFDALEAMAVSTVDDTSVPDETVAEVYMKGYRMGSKVIRNAMVAVTVGGPKREPEDKDYDEESK